MVIIRIFICSYKPMVFMVFRVELIIEIEAKEQSTDGAYKFIRLLVFRNRTMHSVMGGNEKARI